MLSNQLIIKASIKNKEIDRHPVHSNPVDANDIDILRATQARLVNLSPLPEDVYEITTGAIQIIRVKFFDNFGPPSPHCVNL